MSNWLSRIVVAIVGLPIVLGVVYLGGWWMFALATLAAFVALHEFWLLARPLAPLAPAGYVGAALALVGAELGGVDWMVGGLLTTFVLAFILKAISEARAAATIAISATVMGAVWIGGGLAFLILLRELPAHGRLAAFTVLLAVWAGDTFAYFGGRLLGRHKMAPATSPGKTWEGFIVGTAATIFVTFVALYKPGLPDDPPVDRARRRRRGRGADRRPLRVAAQARHGREGHRHAARRPRRHARPHRRAALRSPGRVLHDPRVPLARAEPAVTVP